MAEIDNWTRDLLPYLRVAGLEFEELEQRAWVARLRQSNPDPAVNPPIKLVEFFVGNVPGEQGQSPRRGGSQNPIITDAGLENPA
ncbi:hypothetical protein ALT_0593 [Aspergillus lentulus]|uniref:Uncharacterized protein n=1 Tax=Aspergillus lentulus TaxID=293939 RepID=A0AAN4T6X7_ASPLE|nr:hypothetical protein ALT_0593 [Aspergillus lentulus]